MHDRDKARAKQRWHDGWDDHVSRYDAEIRPLWYRWWLQERVVARGFMWGGIRAPELREVCVPWWAWGFELLYRVAFRDVVERR
jgi:hypothetical protein